MRVMPVDVQINTYQRKNTPAVPETDAREFIEMVRQRFAIFVVNDYARTGSVVL